MRRASLPLLVLALCAAPLHAQVIRGLLLDAASGAPIRQGRLSLLGDDRVTLDRGESDVEGRFLLQLPGEG